MPFDPRKFVGRRLFMAGRFDTAVVLEDIRELGSGFECRVRLPDGSLEELVISADEALLLAKSTEIKEISGTPVDAEQLRLTVESNRIRLAYAHDLQFAVSLSGIRTLPHQNHGDEDKFAHFLRLLNPDLFPEPHRLGHQTSVIRKDILRLGQDCPWALRRLKEDLRDLEGHRLFPDRHAKTVTFKLNSDEYLIKSMSSGNYAVDFGYKINDAGKPVISQAELTKDGRSDSKITMQYFYGNDGRLDKVAVKEKQDIKATAKYATNFSLSQSERVPVLDEY